MLLRPWNLKGLCNIVCFGRLKGVCLFLIFLLESKAKAGLVWLCFPVRVLRLSLSGKCAAVWGGGRGSAPQLLFWCVSRKLLWGFSFFLCILGAITQIFILLSNQIESKFLMVWIWDCLFLVLLKLLSVSLQGQEHSALLPGWCVLLEKPQCCFCHFRALLLPCAGCFLCQRMERGCLPLPLCTEVSGWLRTFILLHLDIPIWALLFCVGLKC